MTTNRRPPDSRLAAARYRAEHVPPLDGDVAPEPERPEEEANTGQATMDQRAQYVEIAIQQALRRGDFDELPGSGKPLTDLGGVRDPDWWIRRSS